MTMVGEYGFVIAIAIVVSIVVVVAVAAAVDADAAAAAAARKMLVVAMVEGVRMVRSFLMLILSS